MLDLMKQYNDSIEKMIKILSLLVGICFVCMLFIFEISFSDEELKFFLILGCVSLLTGIGFMVSKIKKEVFDCMFAIRPEYTVAHALRLSLVLHELLEGIAEAAAEKMPEVVHTAVRQAAQYLADHYSEDVSVAQLAGIMNFSQYHFIRIFKQGMGETPHEFLTRCRINASKKLLLQNLSLEEVAGKVGYHDVNIYIRAFKKLTGTTPHRFRRGIK